MNDIMIIALLWWAFISVSFLIALMFYQYAKKRDCAAELMHETNYWILIILNTSFWFTASYFSYIKNIDYLAIVMFLACVWTIANDVLAMRRAEKSVKRSLKLLAKR